MEITVMPSINTRRKIRKVHSVPGSSRASVAIVDRMSSNVSFRTSAYMSVRHVTDVVTAKTTLMKIHVRNKATLT